MPNFIDFCRVITGMEERGGRTYSIPQLCSLSSLL